MKPAAYRIMEESEDTYWWYRARRDIISHLILRTIPAGEVIVDYGSGTGGTSALLQDLGYRVVAADISDEALAKCKLRGLSTIDLTERPLDDCSADCILAGDVLEHVEDDVELLKTFRRALRPNGTLIVTVPAYEFLWSGEDYVSAHWRRYTRRRLKQQIRSAGLECVWASYYNTLLFPAVLLATLGKRIFSPREMYSSNVKPLARWQNQVLYRVFASEGHLLKPLRFPLGASLIAVARKI